MKKLFPALFLFGLISLFQPVSAQTPLKMRDATAGPQTFAIIVGVSKYKYVRPLTYADKDAELFRDYLKSPGGGSVKDDHIFCLLNEEANNSNFWSKGFQWLKAQKLQKDDRLFIYLAGHGDAIDEDQFFFLGYDCNPNGDKNNYLVSGAIQLFNLKKKIALETSKGVDVFFIMDACRSNELPGGLEGQNFLNTAISEKQAGEIIMLATAAGEESLEDASIGNGHGLFTWYLVEGLAGLADSPTNPDKKISFGEIQGYVDKNVPSVAQERFKRKQDPFFCCNENNDKIISSIDADYLNKWLKQKKAQNRGPGNSFPGFTDIFIRESAADTVLVETYNRFYRAIKNNNLTGQSSAEDYFEQLNGKYPGNPYTLDAKSSLTVQFIDQAQNKINRYLGCGDEGSSKEKQDNFQAGRLLEKAISLVREDDADFANSLLGRMNFLKASGDFGQGGKNGNLDEAFSYARATLAIDPNGAYINNRLAELCIEARKYDSAVYYADKATKLAPKWNCPFITLNLARQRQTQNPLPVDSTRKKPNTANKKIHVGALTGTGAGQPVITYSDWNERINHYSDSLNSIKPGATIKADLGILVQIDISRFISVRPALILGFEGGDLTYDRKSTTGGQITKETVETKSVSASLPVHFIFRFSGKRVTPFISAGPVFSMLLKQNEIYKQKIPIKSFDMLGDAGIGLDIGFLKSHVVIAPEFRYSRGLTNIKGNGNNLFSNTLATLKKQAFTFSVSIRAR